MADSEYGNNCHCSGYLRDCIFIRQKYLEGQESRKKLRRLQWLQRMQRRMSQCRRVQQRRQKKHDIMKNAGA